MSKYAPRTFELLARRPRGEISDAELRESVEKLQREAEQELSPGEMEKLRRRLRMTFGR